MTLIKSISGIRGIIGGKEDQGLTPIDIVKYVGAFAQKMISDSNRKIVLGRDGRISGQAIEDLVASTLYFMGADVINVGLSTTPTVEMAVPHHQAAAGIILTASHNPKQWNALKLLNDKGEFISAAQGEELLALAQSGNLEFNDIDHLGSIKKDDTALGYHIDQIVMHPLVNSAAISRSNFRVAVDAINSSGAIAVPALLEALGVEKANIEVINEEISGEFAHDPEPLDKNLSQIKDRMKSGKFDVGIVVDPDVDRLCFVDENGKLFGEEYTLVAVADYVLGLTDLEKVTVSNLSSSRALKDITEKHGGKYYASAVGEVNVVNKMKEKNAVIGGEGNGGVIDPSLHYGRDALIGTALFLSHLATCGMSASELRASYPDYTIIKNKIDLREGLEVESLLSRLKDSFSGMELNDIDGLKIIFPDGNWVHLRPSNTEPIIRLYSEAESVSKAETQVKDVMKALEGLV